MVASSEYIAEYRKSCRLFSEYPNNSDIGFEYDGEVVRKFQLRDMSKAVVTKYETVNKDIVKACVWHNGIKYFCVRYHKEGFGVVKAQEMITRFCMDKDIL